MANATRKPSLKVGQIAKEFGVTPNTVRAWSKLYAAWLSPTATPADAQTERKYNFRDLAVLREVQKLRSAGKLHHEIVEALNTLQFPDEIETDFQEKPVQQAATAPQTAQDAQLPAIAIDMLREEIRAVRRENAATRDRVTMLLYGVFLGAVGAILLFWLAYGLLALSQR